MMLELRVSNNIVVENDSINAILCINISDELKVIRSKENYVERKHNNNLAKNMWRISSRYVTKN